MLSELLNLVPPEGVKILVVLSLCFLIGLEREEHKTDSPYAFGGVRTFPLIGLLGYALSLLSGAQPLPLAAGFAVVGGFMLLSYSHKLQTSASSGATTEITGLLTYALGALVQRDLFWIAATLVVLSMLLLQLKAFLEGLSRRIPAEEVLSFTKFLLLAVVILPAVPNQDFTVFKLNPYRTWLIVVAVSAVSYAGYVLQLLVRGRTGVQASAVLGGAYSSTVTTVTLAKRAKDARRPHLYAGGILMASGMMYLRLAGLLALFNHDLMRLLSPSFVVLGLTDVDPFIMGMTQTAGVTAPLALAAASIVIAAARLSARTPSARRRNADRNARQRQERVRGHAPRVRSQNPAGEPDQIHARPRDRRRQRLRLPSRMVRSPPPSTTRRPTTGAWEASRYL